jgi:hypothetical protein
MYVQCVTQYLVKVTDFENITDIITIPMKCVPLKVVHNIQELPCYVRNFCSI